MTSTQIRALGWKLFHVSPHFIRKGSRICPTGCPIALAVKERFAGLTVGVSPDWIRIRGTDGVSLYYDNEFADRMTAFDRGEGMEEFYFKMDLARPVRVLEGMADG